VPLAQPELEPPTEPPEPLVTQPLAVHVEPTAQLMSGRPTEAQQRRLVGEQ
jgi:hypothetical protein